MKRMRTRGNRIQDLEVVPPSSKRVRFTMAENTNKTVTTTVHTKLNSIDATNRYVTCRDRIRLNRPFVDYFNSVRNPTREQFITESKRYGVWLDELFTVNNELQGQSSIFYDSESALSRKESPIATELALLGKHYIVVSPHPLMYHDVMTLKPTNGRHWCYSVAGWWFLKLVDSVFDPWGFDYFDPTMTHGFPKDMTLRSLLTEIKDQKYFLLCPFPKLKFNSIKWIFDESKLDKSEFKSDHWLFFRKSKYTHL